MNRHNHGSVSTYIIIALILAAITYIEFAIVEYTFSWLSRGAVMFWLILLSVIKFILVVMFFMHLKEDDKIYTGFFGSGMLLALGTFIGLAFLFTVAANSNFTWTNQSPPPAEEAVVQDSAPVTPPPVDQSQSVVAPLAPESDDFEVGPEPGDDAPVATASFDRIAAEAAYNASCAACHQQTGAGLPGIFPPLAGNAANIVNAGGREVLLHTVLFGMSGPIEVDGTTYNGVMPPWQQLGDADIAAILNHVTTAWGNEDDLVDEHVPYTADEVAASRGLGLSAADVHAERIALDLSAVPEDAPEAEEPAEEPVEEPVEEEPAAEEPAAEEPAVDEPEAVEPEAEEPEAAEPEAEEPAAEEPAAVEPEAEEPEAVEPEAEEPEAAEPAVEDPDAEEPAEEPADEEPVEEEVEEDAAAVTEPADEEGAAEDDAAVAAPAGEGFDRSAAEALYNASCAACHQQTGAGLPGIFPPLANNAANIVNAGGRDVLLHTVVFGLAGAIEVEGATYNGVMPAWPQLSDADVAAILNHITTAWGNEDRLDEAHAPYTAAEVSDARDLRLTPQDVHAERTALDVN